MDNNQLIEQVFRKIERERVIINAANAMRAANPNPQVQQSLNSQIREAQKGIGYLEERLRELQLRQGGQGTPSQGNAPAPPTHGGSRSQPSNSQAAAPTPPAKDGRGGYFHDSGDYGNPGQGGYMNNLGGGNMMMPPRAPFGPQAPGAVVPKPRPNYTKLGEYPRLDPLNHIG